MKIVRIYPKTNFRTFLRSDTLWGNIVYAYKMLYGENKLRELLVSYSNGSIPFIVSTTFPFEIIQNGSIEFVYYFPKPILSGKSINASNPEEMATLKKFKKIKYVEKKIFEDYINGLIDDTKLYQMFRDYSNEMEKDERNRDKDIVEKNKFKSLGGISIIHNLHNSIDRMSGSTLQAEGRGQLYWEGEFSFGNQIGLFFLIDGDNIDLIEAPLRLLSHIGIGGNRTIGKGSFTFEIEDFVINLPTEYNAFITLSLFQPNNDELNALKDKNTKIFYEITTRIGKVAKDFNTEFQEKNPITCFVEGSTFLLNKKPKGNLVSTAKINEKYDIYSNYLFLGIQANVRL